MLRRKIRIAAVCMASLLASFNLAVAQTDARSAILFIGDGMGPTQVTAARIYQANARDGRLALDAMPRIAIVKTHAADDAVTDSAASATALASGVKTNNGFVGMTPDGASVPTLAERAKAAGKAVGIISTATITHATPACFYAHVRSRNDEAGIAAKLIASTSWDLAMGGGRQFFLPRETSDEESGRPGSRRDSRNLLDEAAQAGVRVIQRREDFDRLASDVDGGADPGRVLGVFNSSHMAYDFEREADPWGEPSIAEMTALAIRILSRDPDGYFLTVEGGRIDHACHSNNALLAITDLIAFDAAVKVGIDAAAADPSALVVATADHETGGLSINGYFPIEIGGMNLFTRPAGSGVGDLLTFASGPGARRGERGRRGARGGEGAARDDPAYRQPALTYSGSAAHTGVDVHLWAAGAGSARFGGTMDNTEVALRIAAALGLDLSPPPR